MELDGFVEARVLSVDDIREVAKRREALHANHATSRPLSQDYEFIGLMGQWEFAKEFGLEIDLSDKPGGDGRINFITDIGTISVSTARKPYNLLREAGKECARYHVLAKYKEKRIAWTEYQYTVQLLGWESDEEMLKCPVRSFGHNIQNHYKHVRYLRPMIEMRYLLLGEGIQVRLL